MYHGGKKVIYRECAKATEAEPSLEMDFVLKSVEQLIVNHGISFSAETLIHSGPGCHYASYRFIQIMKEAVLRQRYLARATAGIMLHRRAFSTV